MTIDIAHARAGHESRAGGLSPLGGPEARLLAGPVGVEDHIQHRTRLGALRALELEPETLLDLVRESGLEGRGGAQFALWRKLACAREAGGGGIVVLNAKEGEPASRKDATLLAMRPNLLLDGALVAARIQGAEQIVIYLHAEASGALVEAIRSRDDTRAFRLADAPHSYVAGETSAVVHFLESGRALPRTRPPAAASGVHGLPTVVMNAETAAHLALIARFGAEWFRGAGSVEHPGSTLVTVHDPALARLEVLEVTGLCVVADALDDADDIEALLIGGYEGIWTPARDVLATGLDRHALRESGAPLGCGLVAVLREQHCGLRTAARIVDWLAGESAGQCGPCVYGLPRIAMLLDRLGRGVATRGETRELHSTLYAVMGRGSCGHPTGVARMVESALDTFGEDVRQHRRRGGCARPAAPFVLPGG